MFHSHFQMWGMLILMAFGALAGPLMHGTLLGSLRAAYPADPARREALRRCSEMDTDFSRFSERDRGVCYEAVLRGASGKSAAAD